MTPSTPVPGPAPRDPIEAIAARLLGSRRVAITSHVSGDGDSVGSCLALSRALRRAGKEAVVLLPDLAGKYGFLVRESDRVAVGPLAPRALEGCDLGVLLDASEPRRIGALEPDFFGAPFPRLCVDHHRVESGRAGFALEHIDPTVAATGCLVLDLLGPLGVALDADLAEPLFVAIATDTGWMRHANADAAVFARLSRLAAAGARPEGLYQRLFERLSFARVVLQGIVLERMRAELDGRFIWSALDAAAIAAAGVPRHDFEGLIDPLRTVDGGCVAALLTESEPGLWKISLRSREPVDVQRVAAALDGGGHARAAGGQVRGDLDSVLALVRREVARELGPSAAG